MLHGLAIKYQSQMNKYTHTHHVQTDKLLYRMSKWKRLRVVEWSMVIDQPPSQSVSMRQISCWTMIWYQTSVNAIINVVDLLRSLQSLPFVVYCMRTTYCAFLKIAMRPLYLTNVVIIHECFFYYSKKS